MPTIRKLTPEDIEAIRRKGKPVSDRQQVAAEYDAYLADLVPGDYAEVQLVDGENRATVAARLKAAGQRRGLRLRFARASSDRLRFEVVAQEAS